MSFFPFLWTFEKYRLLWRQQPKWLIQNEESYFIIQVIHFFIFCCIFCQSCCIFNRARELTIWCWINLINIRKVQAYNWVCGTSNQDSILQSTHLRFWTLKLILRLKSTQIVTNYFHRGRVPLISIVHVLSPVREPFQMSSPVALMRHQSVPYHENIFRFLLRSN